MCDAHPVIKMLLVRYCSPAEWYCEALDQWSKVTGSMLTDSMNTLTMLNIKDTWDEIASMRDTICHDLDARLRTSCNQCCYTHSIKWFSMSFFSVYRPIWHYYVALLYGITIWHYYMALLYGITIAFATLHCTVLPHNLFITAGLCFTCFWSAYLWLIVRCLSYLAFPFTFVQLTNRYGIIQFF